MFHAYTFFLPWALLLTNSECPHDHRIFSHHFFSFVSLALSLSVTLSILLTHIFGCLTPHTPFASLVSRTLATRTVMSSMRSWILQLWPPLPAHEALLSLALGTLSSMQPSSLAHTSACHYRPFPSDFGLKVHRLMHSFPSSTPLHMHWPPFICSTWFPCLPSSLVLAIFWIPTRCCAESFTKRYLQAILFTKHNTRSRNVHNFWCNRETILGLDIWVLLFSENTTYNLKVQGLMLVSH